MMQAIIHVPFDCPQCSCSYHVELDLFKLTRLNRVAVCGRCRCEFDVSIRLNRGDDIDTAKESPPPARAQRPTPAPVRAPAPSPPPAAAHQRAARPRKAPLRQRTKPDGLGLSPEMLAALSEVAEVEPKLRGTPTEPDLPRLHTHDGATVGADPDRTPTEPSLPRPREDDDGLAEPGPEPGEDPEATPSSRAARVATLPGTRGAAAPSRVEAHIIVEVGTLGGDASKRKTTKSLYRPSRLVTKKGLGVPAALRQSSDPEREA